MEPRQVEKPVESPSEAPTSPPSRQAEPKRRFQIVKLEERIAPAPGGVKGSTHVSRCFC
jgi:hypothetical protein